MNIPILMYHSVMLESFDHLTLSLGQFRKQMEHLSKSYSILSLNDILKCDNLEKIPSDAIIISFDDSLKNNIDYALPILNEFNFKAVFFVAAGSLPGENWWNKKSSKGLENMTPQDLQTLVKSGHTIGNHSLSHAQLPDLSNKMLKMEFIKSNEILEEKLGFRPEVFAYPYGNADQRCIDLCKEHFKYGFATIKQGYFDWNTDPSNIRRIHISPSDGTSSLDYKISCYKQGKQPNYKI
jgi:peptidoglycan/xylan/chitin deacetylase (PgdA/CDA1 family)